MPELPEVETIANGLNKRVAGDRIESVWLGSKPEPLKSSAEEISSTLQGSRLERVRRVGKHIVFDLASAELPGVRQWIVHLGMSGRLLVSAPDVELPKHTHLVARLASGRELRFVDPRRFGRLEVRQTSFSGPGAEPLQISADDFSQLFHRSKAAIKGGGSSISDYVDSNGDAGFFQIQHRAYGRQGQPCLTCKTPIRKIVVAGRGTHYCPK